MNVLKALIGVRTMQLAPTLKGVTPALANLDTQVMVSLAQVCKCIKGVRSSLLKVSYTITFQTLMSASATMEVATTTAITHLEATLVPAILATDLTVMDTHVKVRY